MRSSHFSISDYSFNTIGIIFQNLVEKAWQNSLLMTYTGFGQLTFSGRTYLVHFLVCYWLKFSDSVKLYVNIDFYSLEIILYDEKVILWLIVH